MDSCAKRAGQPVANNSKPPSVATAAAEATPAVPQPSFPALPCSKKYDRLLIEFCCGENSKMGMSWRESRGCRVARVTIANDVTTPAGLRYVQDLIEQCDGPHTLLWAAMPCTGGSPWQFYNQQFAGARIKIREHLRVFSLIFDTFLACARQLVAKGGFIVNEWPRNCTYWKRPEVKKGF